MFELEYYTVMKTETRTTRNHGEELRKRNGRKKSNAKHIAWFY